MSGEVEEEFAQKDYLLRPCRFIVYFAHRLCKASGRVADSLGPHPTLLAAFRYANLRGLGQSYLFWRGGALGALVLLGFKA